MLAPYKPGYNKIATNTEFTTNPVDSDTRGAIDDDIVNVTANLNINGDVDNTEFTTNSADVDISRAVNANIGNAAINYGNNEG